jgi:dihydrodipicolinate reductase
MSGTGVPGCSQGRLDMKALLTSVLGAAMVFAVVLSVQAQDAKDAKDAEKTLKGSITCAKCDLKKADKCETVIVVKEKDKDVVYHFDAAAHKKYHAKICTQAMPGTVVGTVADKDKKLVVTVKKLEWEK